VEPKRKEVDVLAERSLALDRLRIGLSHPVPHGCTLVSTPPPLLHPNGRAKHLTPRPTRRGSISSANAIYCAPPVLIPFQILSPYLTPSSLSSLPQTNYMIQQISCRVALYSLPILLSSRTSLFILEISQVITHPLRISHRFTPAFRLIPCQVTTHRLAPLANCSTTSPIPYQIATQHLADTLVADVLEIYAILTISPVCVSIMILPVSPALAISRAPCKATTNLLSITSPVSCNLPDSILSDNVSLTDTFAALLNTIFSLEILPSYRLYRLGDSKWAINEPTIVYNLGGGTSMSLFSMLTTVSSRFWLRLVMPTLVVRISTIVPPVTLSSFTRRIPGPTFLQTSRSWSS
jgi:hypothetical protein